MMKSIYKVRKVSGSLTITIPHGMGFDVGDWVKVEGDKDSGNAAVILVEEAV